MKKASNPFPPEKVYRPKPPAGPPRIYGREKKKRSNICSSSRLIGVVLLPLLGIDPDNCRRAEIILDANEPASVVVEVYPSMQVDADTGELETVLKKYELVEVE